MQEKEIVRERIHRDFLIRLCEGEFPLGSAIPSLPELCRQYSVGKNTIVRVLQMLKEDGFIATAPGKASEVLFDCDRLEKYLPDLPGFVCDRKLLLDYYAAIRLLFPSICAHASLSCGEAELAQIRELAHDAHDADAKDYIRLSIHFFRAVLTAMDNQLLKKVVEITLQETMIPGVLLCGHQGAFDGVLQQVTDGMDALYRAMQRKNPQQLQLCWEQLLTLYQQVLERALTLGRFPDAPSVKSTRLFGHFDDEKRFILAFSLRKKILYGSYAPGDFLPGIGEAKQQFGVSAITVRSAYEILGEMGFTRTANGRGTQVLPFFAQKKSPLLERAAEGRKRDYLEAVEFLEITCGAVASAAGHISFATLRQDIEGGWNPAHAYSVLTLCHHLFWGTASPAVFSIYQAICGYLYWGFYLADIPANALRESNHAKCLAVIDAWERQEPEVAETLLRSLLQTLHPVPREG